jgi:hypothetical protein
MAGPRTLLGATTTALLAGTLLLTRAPDLVERAYASGVGPVVSRSLTAASSLVDASLAEWIEAGAGVGLLLWLVWVAIRVRRVPSRTGRVRELGLATGELYGAATAVLWLFYLSWGLSYARPPAEVRLGWTTAAERAPLEPDVDELESLAVELVWRVNDLYADLHGFSDGFEPTTFDDRSTIDAAIEQGWVRVTERFGLHPSVAARRGPAKLLLSSELFSWLGIGGFYFPFTGEANINALAPRWQQPHTIAHEKAHQRLIASENEANFYGFLATIHSDHPVVQYSGWLFAQRQALRALLRADPERGRVAILQRYPGVQRDVNHAYAIWSRYDGPLEELGTAVNHAYLTANGVEGGIDSYGRSLELLVRFARLPGGLAGS